jgi:hypothetical protein
LYCWFGYADDVQRDKKMCLPMYSQFPGATLGWRKKNPDPANPKLSFEDFEINGRHCKSGLAYPLADGNTANCTDAIKVMQDGRLLTGENFYKCDPYDNEKPCEIYYTDTDFFTVPCKCALDG